MIVAMKDEGVFELDKKTNFKFVTVIIFQRLYWPDSSSQLSWQDWSPESSYNVVGVESIFSPATFLSSISLQLFPSAPKRPIHLRPTTLQGPPRPPFALFLRTKIENQLQLISSAPRGWTDFEISSFAQGQISCFLLDLHRNNTKSVSTMTDPYL